MLKASLAVFSVGQREKEEGRKEGRKGGKEGGRDETKRERKKKEGRVDFGLIPRRKDFQQYVKKEQPTFKGQ